MTRHLTNAQMLYPCTGAAYDELVESGYQAMKSWDGRMNRKVGFRRPNYEALVVLWTLKAIEIPLKHAVHLPQYVWSALVLAFEQSNLRLTVHVLFLFAAYLLSLLLPHIRII